MTQAPFPDKGSIGTFFSPDPSEPNSTDNPHLKLIQTMFQHNFKQGAYSSDWSTVSLPSSPSEGMIVVRLNTDDSNNKRIYAYDGTNGWEFTAVTTTGTTVVSLGAIDDVTLTSLANGDILQYNSSSSIWENKQNPTFPGNVIISGNLTVSGTTTTINTEEINLADNTIVLNSNATGSASENAGIEIERGDDANKTFIWDETNDRWTIGTETFVAGQVNIGSTLELKDNGTNPIINNVGSGSFQFQDGGTIIYQVTTDGIVMENGYDVEATEFIGDLRGSVTFKAQAGETLAKGDVVYISGISGTVTVVSKADADDASKMPSFGIAAEAITSGQQGLIANFGLLAGLDTSAFSEGDELYVSTTAGSLTATAPSGASSALQKIAKVTRSHASAGSIFIMGAGRTNAVPNLANGTIFIGNASNQTTTSTLDTSIVTENTNLYYTDTRARNAISVTDSGGAGSLSYNSATGVITYTGSTDVTLNSSVTNILSISTQEISAVEPTADRLIMYDKSATALDYVTISTGLTLNASNQLFIDGSVVLQHSDVDDTSVDGATTVPISSNWAYDHENNASAHHTKYALTDDLTSGEITQLQNIGSATISATQWGYVGALDQNLITTSDVTFDSLTLTQTTTAPLSIATGGGFEIDFTGSGAANIRNANGSIYLLAGSGNAVFLGSNGTNSILTVASDGTVDIASGLDVTGDITVSGTVDGVDIAARDHDAVTLVTTSHDYLSLSASGQSITLGQIDISDDTNLVAGTNISLSGDTLNVDDAFLINSGDDTTSGKITAGGLISQNKTTTPDEIGDIKIARLHPSSPSTSAIGDIDNLETFILSKTDSGYGSGTKPGGSNNAFGVISLQTHNGNYFSQLGFETSNNQLWIRAADNSTTWDSWIKVWSEGNDGSGSGLDADLLDGNHASAFATSGHTHNYLVDNADDTTTGTITAAGFTTTGTWTFDNNNSGTTGITQVQVGGTSFSDNDTSLMTAAAINDRIQFLVANEDTLAEMNDVTITGSVANGDLLVYSGSPNNYWTNTKTLNGDYTLDGLTVDNITINGNDITISETGTSDVPQIKIDSAGHGNIVIDRGSTSYDANLMFQTSGSTKWRLWLDGDDTTLAIRDEAQSSDLVTFTSNSGMTIDGSLTVGTATNTVAVDSILDEDDMTSNSATALATQQSIKAYVDSQVASADQLSELTDVTITGSVSYGQLLMYGPDGVTNEWQNVAQTSITSLGTITTGTWQGSVIASAYLDSDTAHLTTDQTFTGTKTFFSSLTNASTSSYNALYLNGTEAELFVSASLSGNKGAGISLVNVNTNTGSPNSNQIWHINHNPTSEKLEFRWADPVNSSNIDTYSATALKLSFNTSGNLFMAGTLTVGTATNTVAVDSILDQDDMSSNSATALATQQSIKAYVDANAGGASAINDLSDVSIAGSGASHGDLLVYQGSPTNAWQNTTTLPGTYTFSADTTFTGGVEAITLNASDNNSILIDSPSTKWAYIRFESGSDRFDIGLNDASNSNGDFQIRPDGNVNHAASFHEGGGMTLQDIEDGANRSVQLSIKANQHDAAATTPNVDTKLILGLNPTASDVYGYLSAPQYFSTSVTETIRFYDDKTQFLVPTRHGTNVQAWFGDSDNGYINWNGNYLKYEAPNLWLDANAGTIIIDATGDITMRDPTDNAEMFLLDTSARTLAIGDSGGSDDVATTFYGSSHTFTTTDEMTFIIEGDSGNDTTTEDKNVALELYQDGRIVYTKMGVDNGNNSYINYYQALRFQKQGTLLASFGDNFVFYNTTPNATESTARTDVANYPIAIEEAYTDGEYVPLIAGYSSDNYGTKTKVGIYYRQTGSGSNLYLGTSNSYSTGVSKAVKFDYNGNIDLPNGAATGTGSVTFGARSDLGMFASGYDLRLAAPDGVYINIDSNSNDTNSVFSISHDQNAFNPSSNLIADFGESQIRMFKDVKLRSDVYITGENSTSNVARLFLQSNNSSTNQTQLYRQDSSFVIDMEGSDPMIIDYGGDMYKFNSSGHLEVGINSSAPQITIGTNDEQNAILKFAGDINDNGTGIRQALMGLDYSDNMLRINHGSSFDGAHNGIQINSDGDVFVSNQLIVGDNTSGNSEAFIIQNSISSASTPFARFKNTNHGGNSFLRFHAENASGTPKYGDVGIDPDEGAIKMGFGVGSSTLPYGGDDLGVRIYQSGAMSFGKPGAGTSTAGRWISLEGNADSSGEGSGRIFFSEHNSTTTDMDDYGMSIGYRGGNTSVTTAGGQSWTGLSQISNGQWGMWGHNNSLAGSLIMFGDRAATFVDFASNDIRNADLQTTVTWNSLTYDNVTDGLMYGSANAELVPLIPVGTRDPGADDIRFQVDLEVASSNDPWITYILPLPTNKGGLTLHVGEIYGSLLDADSGDKITSIRVYGNYTTSFTNTDIDSSGWTTTGPFNTNFGGYTDFGSYNQVTVYVQTTTSTAYDLEINYLAAMCYYA